MNMNMNIVILSRDRASQLDLLLRSMKEHVDDFDQYVLNIIYMYSSEFYAKGYEKIKIDYHDFPNVSMQLEKAMKEDILSNIDPQVPYTIFGCDDDVFVNDFSKQDQEFKQFESREEITSLSLRMHPGITYCYSENRPTPPPQINPDGTWRWLGLPGDWGYPFSIDFSIFRTQDVLPMLHAVPIRCPCDLEGRIAVAWNQTWGIRRPLLISYPKPIILGTPVNKVQPISSNRHGNITAEFLNEQYLAGKKINLDRIGIPNISAPHVDVLFELE